MHTAETMAQTAISVVVPSPNHLVTVPGVKDSLPTQ